MLETHAATITPGLILHVLQQRGFADTCLQSTAVSSRNAWIMKRRIRLTTDC